MKEVGQLGPGVRVGAPQPSDESQILQDVRQIVSHSRRGLNLLHSKLDKLTWVIHGPKLSVLCFSKSSVASRTTLGVKLKTWSSSGFPAETVSGRSPIVDRQLAC